MSKEADTLWLIDSVPPQAEKQCLYLLIRAIIFTLKLSDLSDSVNMSLSTNTLLHFLKGMPGHANGLHCEATSLFIECGE